MKKDKLIEILKVIDALINSLCFVAIPHDNDVINIMRNKLTKLIKELNE